MHQSIVFLGVMEGFVMKFTKILQLLL